MARKRDDRRGVRAAAAALPRRGGSDQSHFLVVLACFVLSGFAGLVYQTAWTRELAFVFGTSELAVATVLAAYMAGLAAGAAVAGRLVPRVGRPVLVYGLLELGVGVTALAVPVGVRGVRALYVAAFGAAGAPPGADGLTSALFYLAGSFVLLMIPTGLMGATLPLLARHAVRRESELGSRIGALYAANTVGAVAGTVLAGFFLLPGFGLRRTIWVAVGANLLVFAAAAFLSRGLVALLPPAASPPPAATRGEGRGRWVLPLVCLSGTVSFAYEVLWTRLLGHLLGGSVYAFATMLASFLTGITLGSALASRWATSGQRSVASFAWAQVGAAALSGAAFHLLDRVPLVARALHQGGAGGLATDVAVAALILLPGATCIGATFPFAVRVLARDETEAGSASARVYAWNTFGAVLGALGTAFLLMPWLGYARLATLAVAVNLVLGLSTPLLVSSARRALAGVPVSWVAAALLLLLAVVPLETPWRLLRSSPLERGGEPDPSRIVYEGVGRSASVVLFEKTGGWRLCTNGLPEARILRRGGPAVKWSAEHWLGALGTMARPEARSMLVVGLGGGIALEAVPASIGTIDVVELEPEVVRANRAIAGERREDPLADPRMRLVSNDARGALLLSRERYDIIASQPSHPWTAGSSNLYTREFFTLVREHLSAEGVFVQWMGLRYVDEALLRILVATLVDVFPHVRVYRPSPEAVLFLAAPAPLPVGSTAPRAFAATPADFGEMGLSRPEDEAVALVLDEAGARAFARGAPACTDDRNWLQMRSPGVVRAARGLVSPDPVFAPHDPLVGPTPALGRVYMVERLIALGFPERAQRVAAATTDAPERTVALGLIDLAFGRAEAGASRLAQALEIDPGLLAARVALLRLRRDGLGGATVADEALAAGVPDPVLAVAEGWRLEADRDWEAVRALESRLAANAPHDPAHADAVRLRVGWRLASRDPALARDATRLLDQIIPPTGADLILRARALAIGGDPGGAFSTLFQLALILNDANPVLARAALGILDELPPGAGDPAERAELTTRLRWFARGSRGSAQSPAPGATR